MFCSKVWWCWSKTWKWFLDHHPRLPEPRQEKWPQLAPTDNYFLSFFSAISSWQSTPHWTKHVGIYLAWALGFSLLMEISALDSGTSSTTCVLGCQLAWARAAASRLPPGNAPLGRDWWQLRELFGDVMTVGSLGSTGYSGLSANFMAIFQQSDITEILNHREWIIIKPSKNEVLLLLGFYAARASPSFTISRSVRKPTVPGHFDLAEDFKIPPGRSAASYLGISAINPSDRLSW